MTINDFLNVGRIQSKMVSYQRKKEKAIECCIKALEISRNPYASLSGGKDSVAMCYIVNEAARTLGKDFKIWTHLSDASFPGTEETCKKVAEALGRRWDVHRCETSAFDAIDGRHRAAFGKSGVFFDSIREYAADKDLSFVGVRASESKRRRKGANVHGQIFRSESMGSVTVCHPLLWFRLEDVAAALYEYQAPIHPIYTKTSLDLGKNSQGEEMFIRLSYITSRDLLNKGTAVFLKLNYPREFAKLCEAWPEIKRFV